MNKIKDPGSAITHFIGSLMAIFAAFPLLMKAPKEPIYLLSMGIFLMSLVLLYSASTIYHTFNLSEKINRRLKKFDHMMIFVLIAGTYTPVCIIVLGNKGGIALLALIWGMALAGIIMTAFWVHSPKWLNAVIYIAMGWTCVLAFTQLINSLSKPAFIWLLAGGVIYTLGGIIYALKLPIFNNRHKYFGSHEIFHLFCIGGSLCHFILMYVYVINIPLN